MKNRRTGAAWLTDSGGRAHIGVIEERRDKRIWLVRGLLLTFAAFFAAIIWIANTGEGPAFWSFLGRIPFGDKLGHLGLVGTFSILLNGSLKGRMAPRPMRPMMLGSLILLVVMSLEELSQAFVSSRTFDGGDWLANVAGIFLGQALLRCILTRRTKLEPGESR